MAVRIRLTKLGKKGRPFYRIVVADSKRKRDGKFIENLGFFDPKAKPPEIKVNQERLKHWLSKGAQMTEGVRKLKVCNEKTS